MSRIQPLSSTDANDEVQGVYDDIEKAFGMVPNLFKTYAHFPSLHKANWEKTKVLMLGGRVEGSAGPISPRGIAPSSPSPRSSRPTL